MHPLFCYFAFVRITYINSEQGTECKIIRGRVHIIILEYFGSVVNVTSYLYFLYIK